MSDIYDLTRRFEELQVAFEGFSRALKRISPRDWERWKAGGFVVSDDVVRAYPNASDCFINMFKNKEKDEKDEKCKELVQKIEFKANPDLEHVSENDVKNIMS